MNLCLPVCGVFLWWVSPFTHKCQCTSLNIWLKFVSRHRLSKVEVTCIVDGGPLGCDAVWTCWWIPTFRKNILPPSSGMKIQAVGGGGLRVCAKALERTHKPTMRHNPEDCHRLFQYRENLRSYVDYRKVNRVMVSTNPANNINSIHLLPIGTSVNLLEQPDGN